MLLFICRLRDYLFVGFAKRFENGRARNTRADGAPLFRRHLLP